MDGNSETDKTVTESAETGVGARERAKAMALKARATAPSLIQYIYQRFDADGCTGIAASLSYTSLLAIVPLLAIGLAMFAAFPFFAGLRQDVLNAIIENMAPSFGSAVQQYLGTFIANAGKTTGAGILALAATAILMIHTIQLAFDKIWGATSRRISLRRFPIYWAVITLGPLLFGVSFSISTYVFQAAGSASFYGLSTGVKILATVMPFVLETIGFALFYRLIPTRPVRVADAVYGAFVAAILFELLKKGFGIYVLHFPSYEVVYGALATIPVFLLWMYLVWVTVLIGAEVAAGLPEWRSGRRSVGHVTRRGDLLSLALGALELLRKAQSHGAAVKTQTMMAKLEADPGRLLSILEQFKAAHLVAMNDAGRWVLSRDLSQYSLHDLFHLLGATLSNIDEERVPMVDALIERLAGEEKRVLAISVEEALKGIGKPPPA